MSYTIPAVIEYLMTGQSTEMLKEVMSEVHKDRTDNAVNGKNIPFYYMMLININLEKLDWRKFFQQIESALTNSEFADHHTSIEQLILESFSNMVAAKSLNPQLLIDNIGPISKAYLIEYEMVFGGKTIFT